MKLDFSNEHYVRVYTRDTTTWRLLGWDGQAVLMQVLRKLDAAGVMDVEDLQPWEAVVIHCGAPEDAAKSGMAKCLERGVLVHSGRCLVAPKYREAQEASKSDKQRQKESRDRRRSEAIGPPVTKRDGDITSRDANVTSGHEPSHAVTSGHIRSLSSVTNAVQCVADADAPPFRREDFGGGRGVRSHDSGRDLVAARGAAWLGDAMGQEPFPHSGKWHDALAELAAKPENEREIAKETIATAASALDNPKAMLTPNHVRDYWHMYSVGKIPGKRDGASQPGAAEVEAARVENERCEREFNRASPENRAAAQQKWLDAGKRLRAVKERYGWTG